MRSQLIRAATAFLLVAAGCKDRSQSDSAPLPGFIQGASADAQQALATPVDFELTEDNFDKWETAQRNLDRIPASQIPPLSNSGGSVIDRAVARLESSAAAKRAIEAAGLSVRDFVLETLALAQAVQASATGRSSSASGIPAGNFAFVEQYRDRIRQAGITAESAPAIDVEVTDSGTRAELARARADSMAEVMDSARRQRDSLRDSISGRDTILNY
jgi:hypothetical protein